MESKFEELKRVSSIAKGKIPVSEDSPVYNLFAERREICRRMTNQLIEVDMPYYINYLNKIEENIKIYLCL